MRFHSFRNLPINFYRDLVAFAVLLILKLYLFVALSSVGEKSGNFLFLLVCFLIELGQTTHYFLAPLIGFQRDHLSFKVVMVIHFLIQYQQYFYFKN